MFTGNKVYTRPSSLREVTLGQYANQSPLTGYIWDNNQYFGLNVFYHGIYDGSSESGGSNLPFAQWQSNTNFDVHSTFTASAPTGTWIYLRPNKYEQKRANITIYNWDLSPSVNVDLSSVLVAGDQFVIQDSQNFFGPPVVSGTYSGGMVSIPMTNLPKATPVGFAAPAHTAPLLGTFVVLPAAAGAASTRPAPPEIIGVTAK